MSQYFPEPYEPFGGDINVKVDLSNYATKTDLKDISHIDVSSYALKSNLAILKTEVDKLDIDKLTSVPIDLAKLSNVVKNDVVKKTEYVKLVNKVNGIDNTNFVSRTKYEKDRSNFEDKLTKIDKKMPDIRNLATKSSITSLLPTNTFNSKITEIENKIKTVDNKIPSITNLATKTELTVLENKILDANGFVKKSDYATEITSIKNDYVTNTAFDSRINSLKNTHISNEFKKIDDKTNKNASDNLALESRLKQKEDIAGDSQREDSFTRGFYYYLQQSYLVYECREYSFKKIMMTF